MSMDITSSIFGDQYFHRELCLVTEVLAHFLRSAPKSLSVEQVSVRVDRPVRKVRDLYRKMVQAGLLEDDAGSQHAWHMQNRRNCLTLSEVYEFVIAMRADNRIKSACNRTSQTDDFRAQIYWMQAALAANQSVIRDLRQFSVHQIARCSTNPLPMTSVPTPFCWEKQAINDETATRF